MALNSTPDYLTQLICTRISHDLIGNIGAVANAVELLEEGDMDFLDDIRSILKVSSGVLSARMKFFRMAFGLSNSNLTDIPTVAATILAYLKTLGNKEYPIELDLELHTSDYTREAMLITMILADTIIKGGSIEAREINGNFAAIVHSQFPLAKEKIQGIKQVLNGEIPEQQAVYAPVVYLQNILNKEKNITIIPMSRNANKSIDKQQFISTNHMDKSNINIDNDDERKYETDNNIPIKCHNNIFDFSHNGITSF